MDFTTNYTKRGDDQFHGAIQPRDVLDVNKEDIFQSLGSSRLRQDIKNHLLSFGIGIDGGFVFREYNRACFITVGTNTKRE